MQEQTAKMIDCAKCEGKPPELLKCNRAAFSLWQKVQGCWKIMAGMGGAMPYALDWQEIQTIAEIHGIQLTERLFNWFQLLEYESLKEWRKDKKAR